MILWARDILHSHDALEDGVGLRVFRRRVHDARTVDEVDALHQRDVLPHLGLARDGGNSAHLFAAQGIDDGTLANIGVADKTNRNLLFVRVEVAELPK